MEELFPDIVFRTVQKEVNSVNSSSSSEMQSLSNFSMSSTMGVQLAQMRRWMSKTFFFFGQRRARVNCGKCGCGLKAENGRK